MCLIHSITDGNRIYAQFALQVVLHTNKDAAFSSWHASGVSVCIWPYETQGRRLNKPSNCRGVLWPFFRVVAAYEGQRDRHDHAESYDARETR
jgi:hypothetical protein